MLSCALSLYSCWTALHCVAVSFAVSVVVKRKARPIAWFFFFLATLEPGIQVSQFSVMERGVKKKNYTNNHKKEAVGVIFFNAPLSWPALASSRTNSSSWQTKRSWNQQSSLTEKLWLSLATVRLPFVFRLTFSRNSRDDQNKTNKRTKKRTRYRLNVCLPASQSQGLFLLAIIIFFFFHAREIRQLYWQYAKMQKDANHRRTPNILKIQINKQIIIGHRIAALRC